MAMFGASKRESYDALYPVLNQPADTTALEREQAPGMLQGDLLGAVGTGAYRGLSRGASVAANVATPALRPLAKSLDEIFRTDIDGFLLDEQAKANRALFESKIDPKTNGAAAQLLYGLGDVLTTVVSTGGNPYAAGGLYGITQTGLGMADGLDPATATAKGIIEGLGLGVGVALAPAYGTTLLQKLLSGAGVNVGVGVATRAPVSVLLNARGYPEMAQQYAPLDATSIVTDAVLGAAFGGFYRGAPARRVSPDAVPPSTIDAALTANQAKHAEIDVAPGIPTDTRSRQAHAAALDSAVESLVMGRDVNVEGLLREAGFTGKPGDDLDVGAVVRSELERAGATDALRELDAILAEAKQRGIPLEDISRSAPGPVRYTDNLRGILRRAEEEGWESGRILLETRMLVDQLERRNEARDAPRGRERGELWVREKLLNAERNGSISAEARRLMNWMLDRNPEIADDLAISIRSSEEGGAGGNYNPAARLMTIFKGKGSDTTPVHELLHHTERMMPEEIQRGIRLAWIDELQRLRDTASRAQLHELMQAIDDAVRAAAGDAEARARIVEMVQRGELPYEFYRFTNPSEYWAVNAARIVSDRANVGGWVAQARQWLLEFIEKIKEVFGFDNDASIIRGLEAVLKGDGALAGRMISEGDTFDQIAKPGVERPGAGVAQENLNGFEPGLRVKVPLGKVQLPAKPLVLTGTNIKNAQRQIDGIDETLKRFPNADKSPLEWSRMIAYAMATDDVPVPPYRFLAEINGEGAFNNLSRLTKGQIEDARHGFENAEAFRQAYIGKELDVETTGKLFMWSFLSRGVSPYVQESLFIDAFPGVDKWIKKAAAGELTEGDFDAYTEWAKSVAPQGSGQPGAGATHNLNAFGKLFLFKMGKRDAEGVSLLQRMHDMMEDPSMTGQQIRRWFTANTEGVGIDNKVVSFTLLVAGFKDVMVLDRVQIRQLWDDGRFGERNLYDGRKVDGKPVAGSMLSEITYGARGLLIYEAIERALAKRIEGLYTRLGRPEDASIGRYHWETWVADSQQEASHGTLDAILHDARGNNDMIAEVTAKEGEYGAFQYGARYGRTAAGEPYFKYQVGDGPEHLFTVQGFRDFIDAVKSTSNKVIPTGFKVSETGNAPWYQRPEVNRAKLETLAEQHSVKLPEGEGARAVQADAKGQAVPDLAGQSRQKVGAVSAAKDDVKFPSPEVENPTMEIPGADGRMIRATDALEQAGAEAKQAAEMAKGMQVAAECALRFGSGQ